MSQVRVRVRSGEYEFEVECSKEDIGPVLELTDQFIEILVKIRGTGSVVRTVQPSIGAEGEDTSVGSAEIPQISSTTLSEAIMELLASQWGREPRTVREVMEALEVNALHYPQSTVGPQLIRLTQAGKLRRLKKGDLYSYVIAKKPSVESS